MSYCDKCAKLEAELSAMTVLASKAMSDYETANLRAIRAEAEVEMLNRENEWHPNNAETELPEDWKSVIVIGKNHEDDTPHEQEAFMTENGWMSVVKDLPIFSVTHWRLMPTFKEPK